MRVALNGEPAELAEGASVSEAVTAAGIEPDRRGIAVAVNGEVVPRGRWQATVLAEGQSVEVVEAMQGG
jgi:sulfur carrier protein